MKMARFLVVWLVWAAMALGEPQGLSGCLEKERMGLLELRRSLKLIDFTHLPGDCCSWDGVNCSATTGRVQRLTLFPLAGDIVGGSSLNISLLLPFEELLYLTLNEFRFSGFINQQDLIKLTRLETLTMRYASLSNLVSLQAFANMKNLKYLDLSYNNMNSDLKGICEMKNIIELDLSYNAIRGHLPSCIGNLTHLQALHIGNNHITGNIPSTIGNLSHLYSLDMRENFFSGSFSLHFLSSNSKLENLELSSFDNNFHLETETQSWFPSFQLKNLVLESCNLNKMSHSVIPSFLLHQFELMSIYLDGNNLHDTFPSWLLQNNSKLRALIVVNNSLTGNLILPNFTHKELHFIAASDNMIGGKLPNNMPVFLPLLEFLLMSKNRFEGNLPSPFGGLGVVDLSFNSFSGALPKTLLANHSFLLHVDLSDNLLHGEISLNFTTLPYLRMLRLRNNIFSGIIEELTSQSSSQLEVFDISNNLISSKLSNSIANFSSLKVLIVSNNSFEGRIPDKLCHMKRLEYLDISHNKLHGLMPSCLKTLPLKFVYMRNCNLSGAIPDDLSIDSTLKDIDLSYNYFSPGTLPNWIYSQHDLQILLMAGLRLEGEISMRLCALENIKIMDLSHNSFSGTIPSCLFTRPFWVAESQVDFYSASHSINDTTMRLAHGYFEVEFTTKGTSMRFQGDILNYMNGLDLSSNQLSGQIPPQIGNSEAIHAVNLSNNRLWGSIPSSISRLREIESLDLSSNDLSGEIPSEIVRLNFLSFFNVSNNNLRGRIPIGGQFSNFDERNYGGNELLCGPLLPRVCTTSSSPPTTKPHNEQEEDDDDETIFERTSFWWSFFVAYVIVFITVVIVLGMDTHPYRVWFFRVDVICSILACVFVKLKCILPVK